MVGTNREVGMSSNARRAGVLAIRGRAGLVRAIPIDTTVSNKQLSRTIVGGGHYKKKGIH